MANTTDDQTPSPSGKASPDTPLPKSCCCGCRVVRWLVMLPIALPLVAGTLWAAAALHFDVRISWMRMPLVILFLGALLYVWIRKRSLWRKVAPTLLLCGLVLGWWLSLKPSNTRDWQPDVAVPAHADIQGNMVTMYNVRNCEYRTEEDYTVRHYDKTYDLDKLQSADLYMVYWGSPAIAHTMISFGFESGDYLCFSIETREEKGESYSAIKGFFRQFEVFYVAADERDLVRLRTNYRKGEDVYLFRLAASPEKARRLLLTYLRRLNDLRARPEWYNALTHNCTTGIRMQRAASDRAPWDWRMLANGYGDELLYERGSITTNLPLPELKRKCLVNGRAKEAGDAGDFSARIREGVPGIVK